MVVPAVLTTCQKMRMEHCGKPLRAAGETGPADAGSAAGASRAPTAGRCPVGSSAAGSSPPRSDSARLAALANPARSSAAATANSVLDNWPSELESARVNVAVLLSVLTSARSRGSHADVAEWKSHSATMHTKTMISALVVRIVGGRACHAAADALQDGGRAELARPPGVKMSVERATTADGLNNTDRRNTLSRIITRYTRVYAGPGTKKRLSRK